MSLPSRFQQSLPFVVLGLLTLAIWNASLRSGGMDAAGWNASLVLIAAAALAYWLSASPQHLAPPLPKALRWRAGVLAGLLTLQVIPLPLGLLKFSSSARAEFLTPLPEALGGICCSTLSLSPLASLVHIARWIACILVALLARELAWRWRERIWILAGPILALGMFQAVLGFLQYAENPAQAIATGTYLNRNHFAGFLEMVLPFVLLAGWEIVARNYKPRKPFPFVASAKICGLIVVLGAIVMAELRSLSRLGPVSMLASLVVMAALALPALRRRASFWGAIIAAVLIVGAGLAFLAPDRLLLRFEGMQEQTGVYDARQIIWRDTLHMVRDYPVTGVGWGAFGAAFPRYQSSLPDLPLGYAHNDYLQFIAELGVPGGLLWIVMITYPLRQAVRTVAPNTGHPRVERFALACGGALSALLVHSLGDYNLYVPANAVTFAWIAGLAMGLDPQASQAPLFSRKGKEALTPTVVNP